MNLSKLLNKYGVLTSSFALCSSTNAEVIYVSLNLEHDFENSSVYQIDLDNNGVYDFEIEQNRIASIEHGKTFIYGKGLNGSFLGFDENYYFNYNTFDNIYAYSPQSSLTICTESNWVQRGAFFGYYWRHIYGYVNENEKVVGLWENWKIRIAGFKFNIDGDEHFGWLRLFVTGEAIYLFDYAYEDEPNTCITRERTLHTVENQYSLDATYQEGNLMLSIDEHLLNGTIQIFDLQGKSYANNNLVTLQSKIELEPNVYIINISKGDEIITKKINCF